MIYHLLWFFFVYAFLGWCSEVGYAATKTGKFVNRGFLNGPWCPVYGFGVVIVLGCLDPLSGNLPLLFLGSVALTSALEWLTGFVLEKLFHQRWWDYSDEPFNLTGYICLRFSLMWGFACLFVVKLLHPTVVLAVDLLPRPLGWVLLAGLCAALGVDLAATVSAIAKLNRRLVLLDELAGRIRDASDGLGEDLAQRLAQRRAALAEGLDDLREDLQDRAEASRKQLQEWRASAQELLDKSSRGQRRLLRAFPSLRSVDHRAALERLRRRLERK